MHQTLTWTVGLPGSSHAETALARRGNIGVSFNFIIVQTGIKARRCSSTWGEDRVCLGRDLVGSCWLEKGGSGSNKEGQQEGKDRLLHGGCHVKVESQEQQESLGKRIYDVGFTKNEKRSVR
jgi:hypothetical protein